MSFKITNANIKIEPKQITQHEMIEKWSEITGEYGDIEGDWYIIIYLDHEIHMQILKVNYFLYYQ